MKKEICLLFLLIFATFTVHAQGPCCNPTNSIIVNGDFSNASCKLNPFVNNCVQNWVSPDGTPSLIDYNGTRSAWMWSVEGVGEAIASRVNFERGVTYNICFRIKTGDRNTNDPNVANLATFNLVATNNIGNVTATPNGDIIYQDTMGSYLYNWTTVTVQYTPTADYERLWIFPYMAQPRLNGLSQAEMTIDDIIVSEHINIVVDPNPLVMENDYCESDAIVPLNVPSNVLDYQWEISEITAGGLVTQYTSPSAVGPAPLINLKTLWNGFQAGKQYRVTLIYDDDCGNTYPYYYDFSIKEEINKFEDITLQCGQSFDISQFDFIDPCSGQILAIEDMITNTSYPPNAPLSLSQDALLKVTYPDCCILYLNIRIQKEEEIVREFCPSKDGKLLIEACGNGSGGYYDYYVNNTAIRTTDPSMWVSYVPGNSYSVSYTSPQGCICTVVYKLAEPVVQNVYATWCAGTTSFDLSTIIDPNCQQNIDGFKLVNNATGQTFTNLTLTDPNGGYDIFGNGGNGDLLCLTYTSFEGSCTKCITNITLRFYNGNCANVPVPVYCSFKREAPYINGDIGKFEKEKMNNNVYPNPSNGNYTVTLDPMHAEKVKTFSITVKDISGKTILNEKAINATAAYGLDISKYTSGIYFLSIEFGSKKEVKKLIKK
ncbi:T9SS type A sorting domain-containing protein [uncultured Kordia sp.]|uniref:T9SS type A sorting domain-containing protein n=1 Tax=uncultured Kordia sp. TaxID=507699 RepID=UPI0026203C0C|nr:T9SS type A sorting domain-containing protein [uncultured Kordia sp.]